MIKIDLKYNYGFKWYQKDGIYVKGYLFDNENKLYQNEDLISYFTAIHDYHSFREKMINAHGLFSVIIVWEELAFLGSDINRTFPLFYFYEQNNLFLSDSSHYLAETYSKKIDELRSIEYLATGYTIGKYTLFTVIYQIQPGQILCFKDGKEVKREFYFSYVTDKIFDLPYDELKVRMKEKIDHAFDRLIQSIGNRQIIVPLSGGYDSRLIVTALKIRGIDNVICITYGKKNAEDIPLSKRVAEKLGYKWIFVEHTPDYIGNYIESDEFAAYYPYAANGFGFSYMFEYFGVRYLKSIIGIPADSVFIHGHSGDFLGGSQITKFGISSEYSVDQAANKIYHLKFIYVLPEKKYASIFKNNIKEYLNPLYEKQNSKYSYSFLEDWDYREKLSKTNANSSNVFSFFGFQYRLPYWDKEIVEFFRCVPYKYKLKKRLYNEVLEDYYFKPFQLIFPDEMKVSSLTYRLQRFKERLKRYMPYWIKKRSTLKIDWANYHLITAPMAEQLKTAGIKFRIYDLPFNVVIMQWYLAKLKHEI